MEETLEKKSGGYGKRPLWQWIFLYIGIGVVVYGIIYFVVFAKKGGYTTSQNGQYHYPMQSPTTPQASPATTKQQNTITLTQQGWSPATLTLTAGQTVTWINKSGQDATVNSNPHPTHTDYPPLNLGRLPDGGSLSLSFPKTGTYGYHNHLNPSETGTIRVQ